MIDYDKAKDEFLYHADRYLTPDKSGKGFICPICGSGSGPNGTGIVMQDINKTKGKQEFTCFGHGNCFVQQDLLDIIAKKYGIPTNAGNFLEIIKTTCQEYGYFPEYNPSKTLQETRIEQKNNIVDSDSNQYKDFILKSSENLDSNEGIRALKSRGISLGTAKKGSRVGFDNTGKYGFKGLVFSDGDNFASFSIRNADVNVKDGMRWRKHGEAVFFNFETIKNSDWNTPYFLVEGELDALSIMEVGGEAVALGSTSNIKKFIQKIKEEKILKPIILALDNDKAGEKARIELNEELSGIEGIKYIVSSLEGEVYKDPNEFLCNNKEILKLYINEDIENFEHKNNGFVSGNILARKYIRKLGHHSQSISTGYPILDEMLAGGLRGGALYCIGAPSSVGKTSFSQSIADHIAESGINVIYFTFEMSANEMMIKTISRLSFLEDFQDPININDFDDNYNFYNLEESKKERLYSAFDTYINKIGSHMYLNEGEIGEVTVDMIEKIIKSFISSTGTKPVIFLDYLQILQQSKQIKGTQSEKQIVDYNIFKLKRLSREYDIPIFVISSFNRQSYDEPSMSAFKESGSIEFTADCIFTLFRNTIGLKKKDAQERIDYEEEKGVRTVILTILKNRRGKVGSNIMYEYYPAYNYFEEIGLK